MQALVENLLGMYYEKYHVYYRMYYDVLWYYMYYVLLYVGTTKTGDAVLACCCGAVKQGM